MKSLNDLLQAFHRFQERRSRLMGINLRNRALVSRINPRRHRQLADDKLTAKEILSAAGIPTIQTVATFAGLGDVPDALNQLKSEHSFVLKPACGSGGRGIVVITGRDGPNFIQAGGKVWTPAALRRHMAEIVFGAYSKTLEDRGFVERRIVAHPEIHEVGPAGLCDIRVLVLHGQPFAAMMRVPTRKSAGRANLHAGGLGLGIDLSSGVVTRAVQSGKARETHPDTGLPLVGRVLPHWETVKDVAARAASAFPLGYLGVDVCVDEERGPLVLEVNVRAGLEIQNICGVTIPDALEAR